jgi:chloramphenicol 3-O-phosphotransferase
VGRGRPTRRRPPGAVMRQVREECDRMHASGFADVCVDTTGVPAAEVARLVRDSCGDWPGFRVAVRDSL